MNMEQDPDFGEIPDYVAERLRLADARFREAQGDSNPFTHLRELGRQVIFGTMFSVYDARGRNAFIPGVAGASAVPILAVYSTQSRFAGMCDLICGKWVPELEELVAALAREEERGQPAAGVAGDGPKSVSPRPGNPDPGEFTDRPDEITLESFGLMIAADCYVIGYRDARSPLVVRKELILEILKLVAEGLQSIGLAAGPEVLETLLAPALVNVTANERKMD